MLSTLANGLHLSISTTSQVSRHWHSLFRNSPCCLPGLQRWLLFKSYEMAHFIIDACFTHKRDRAHRLFQSREQKNLIRYVPNDETKSARIPSGGDPPIMGTLMRQKTLLRPNLMATLPSAPEKVQGRRYLCYHRALGRENTVLSPDSTETIDCTTPILDKRSDHVA